MPWVSCNLGKGVHLVGAGNFLCGIHPCVHPPGHSLQHSLAHVQIKDAGR